MSTVQQQSSVGKENHEKDEVSPIKTIRDTLQLETPLKPLQQLQISPQKQMPLTVEKVHMQSIESMSNNQIHKHEQRRMNLRKKRVRDQMMQVVDGYIRDQTVLLAYITYVQANVQNDEKQMQKEVIDNVVVKSTREIIQEVLRDMYNEKCTSIIIDQTVRNQIYEIAQVVLESITVTALLSDDGQMTIDNDVKISSLVDSICEHRDEEENCNKRPETSRVNESLSHYEDCNSYNSDEETLKTEQGFEIDEKINMEILEEYKEELINNNVQLISSDDLQESYQSEKLEKNIDESLIQALLNSAIEQMAFNEIVNDEIQQSMSDQLIKQVIDNEIEELFLSNYLTDTIVEQVVQEQAEQECLIHNMSHVLSVDVWSSTTRSLVLEIASDCLEYLKEEEERIAEVYDGIINFQTAHYLETIYRELQDNFQISQSIADQYLNQNISRNIVSIYNEEVSCEVIKFQSLEEALMRLIVQEIFPEITVSTELPSQIQDTIVSEVCKNQIIQIFKEEELSETIVNQYLLKSVITSILDSTIKESIECDQTFDILLKEIIRKEAGFIIQVEKDSIDICESILSQMMITSNNDTCAEQYLDIEIRDELNDKAIESLMLAIIDEIHMENQCLKNVVVETSVTQILNNIGDDSKLKEEEEEAEVYEVFLSCESNDQVEDAIFEGIFEDLIKHIISADSGSNMNHIQKEETAISQIGSSMVDEVVSQHINSIAQDIQHRIISEHVYKRTMNKVIKRQLYHIIQTSVDVIYNLEEDTILLANQVLDRFLIQQIESTLLHEIKLNKDSQMVVERILDYTIHEQLLEVIRDSISEQTSFEFKRKPLYVESKLQPVKINMRQSQRFSDPKLMFSNGCRSNDLCLAEDIKSDDEQMYTNIILSPNNVPKFKKNSIYGSKSLTNSISKNYRSANAEEYYKSPTDIEKLAIRFTQDNQQDNQNYDYGPTDLHFRSSSAEFNGPTARCNFNQKSKYQSCGSEKSLDDVYYSAINTLNPLTHRSHSQAQFQQEAHQNSQLISIRAPQHSLRVNQVEEDDDDLLCTVQSDEDESVAYSKYTKKIEKVKAHQPKEGFKFIEKKNKEIADSKNFIRFKKYSDKGEKQSHNMVMNLQHAVVKKSNKSREQSKTLQTQGQSNQAQMRLTSPTSFTLNNPHINDTLVSAQSKVEEIQVNKELEKLIVVLGQKFKEINRNNQRSNQLLYIQVLQQLASQVLNCQLKIDKLFDIDVKLKEILTSLQSERKNHQEYFGIILITNQLALLNYQKLQCLIEKKQPILRSTKDSLNSMNSLNSQKSNTQTISSYGQSFTTKTKTSHIIKKQKSQGPLKKTITSVQPLNLNVFQSKDQQYLLKCIGRTDGAELCQMSFLKSDGESCSEFQRRHFYLMTLHHVIKNKVRTLPRQFISIEDLYNQMKVERVHHRDWKDFIARGIINQISLINR